MRKYAYTALLSLTSVVVTLPICFAQEVRVGPSGFCPLHWETGAYPRLEVDVIAVENGEPVKLSAAEPDSRVRIAQGKDGCSVISVATPARALEYDVHVFLDLNSLSWTDMQSISLLLKKTADRDGLHLSAFYYVPGGKSVMSVSPLVAKRLKVDSTPDTALSMSSVMDSMRSIASTTEVRGRIFWIAAADFSTKYLALIDSLLKRCDSRGPSWLVVQTKTTEVTDSSEQRPGRLLMLESLETPPESLETKWNACLDLLVQSSQTVVFQPPLMLSATGGRSFNVEVGRHLATFDVTIADSTVRSALLIHYRAISRKLKDERKYLAALDSLAAVNRILGKDAVRGDALTLIKVAGESLLKSQHPEESAPLLDRAERDWGIQPTSVLWYRQLKSDLIEARLRSEGEDKSKELDLREKLAVLHPENRTQSARLLVLRGESALKDGDFWSAAQCFKGALAAKHNPSVQKALQKAVADAVTADNANGEFTRLYEKGSGFIPEISLSFELRFMYANSCMQSHNYVEAASHFEWCVLKWNTAVHITTWDNLFARLQDAYAYSMRFDDAYRVNRRLYQQRGDKVMLLHAMKNLRARLLAPLINCLTVFMERVGTKSARTAFLSAPIPGGMPQYVQAVCFTDSNGSLRTHLGNRAPYKLPTQKILQSLQLLPALLSATGEDRTYWLINRTADGFVVIAFSDETDKKEGNILETIRSERTIEGPWKSLVEYEQEIGTRFLAEVFANMLSAEYAVRGGISLGSYWRELSAQSPVIYITLHDQNGAISQGYAFDRSKAEFDDILWRRSSTSLAFFSQEIKYSGKPVLDVSNPIYVNRTWKASVRIGVQKL
jgi:hypothetical protein